jgi:hypothetical protein
VDSVDFTSLGTGELFFLLFFDTYSIPGNLVAGVYPEAQRSPFAEPGHPGLWLAWNHAGCNEISGSFTVLEAVFGPSGPESFSAQFEQSCEGFMPPLTGTFTFSDETTAVPEPATYALMVAGLAGILATSGARLRVQPMSKASNGR